MQNNFDLHGSLVLIMQNYVGQIDYLSPGVIVYCSDKVENCVEL
jgi:hypothetical protein